MSSHASNCVRPAVQTTHTCRFLQPCRGLTSRQIRLSTPSPAYSTHRQTRQCIARAENDNKSQTDLQDEPVWARRERLQESGGLPFGIYLIGSFLVATAAIGSIFEYSNKNPVFGLLPPSSPFYTPILGFFAVTGLPSAGLLFTKAIKAANEAAERQDKADGF